jgi:hypothetical protein
VSLRNSLAQAIANHQEKCCTVASLRECNNATNPPKRATLAATSHATDEGEACNSAGFAATSYATNGQQVPQTAATTEQQQAVIQLQIEMIKAWLFKIGEPSEDHHIVLSKCRNDPEALAYFLKHARGEFE